MVLHILVTAQEGLTSVAITWYLCLQRKDKRNKTKVRDFLTAETIKSMVFCSKRTRICRRWWDRKFYVVAGRADREKEGKEQFTKKGASVRYLEVFSLTLLQKSQSLSGSIMQCKIQLQSASQSFKRTGAVCIVLPPSIRSFCNVHLVEASKEELHSGKYGICRTMPERYNLEGSSL